MKKILILGSSTQNGSMIYKYLHSLNKYAIFDVDTQMVNSSTEIIDIGSNRGRLRKYIDDLQPNIIINCLVVLVKASEENPESALWINTELPRWLAGWTAGTNIKIIHLSTDCVFSGYKGSYMEDDVPDGIGRYATTKAMGEIENDKDLTIRCSVVGPDTCKDEPELFEWFLRQTGEVKGYSEVYWNGVTSLCLAQNIDKMIDANVCGLYQLAPHYSISKYNLLKLWRILWNRTDITVVPYYTDKKDKTLICSQRVNFIPDLPYLSYSEMFTELKTWMENHE